MRQLIVIAVVLASLGMTIAFPFAGVLVWAWFTLQNPHQEAYGFIQSAPTNLIIAIVTVFALLLSKERKLPPLSGITTLLLVFLIWMTINSFFAFSPDWSWPFWSRTWRIFAFGLVVAATTNTRVRFYALTWICVISLFYYGLKGGAFTLLTAGQFRVFGPPGSIIGDNNQIALALLMVLPLAQYLRSQVSNRFLSLGLLLGILLTVVAIVGSYSRGAFVGLGALAFLMLLRSRNKLAFVAAAGLMAVFVLLFMPGEFFGRMQTIGDASQDASFEGRLYAWQVAFYYARDHFPFGAGLYGPQLGGIFHAYFPKQPIHAAHSIYFQVLGENGFIGFFLYLGLIICGFLSCWNVISACRHLVDFQWAKELAIALQASLFVFCVAGAALSMAYYDLFIVELGMLIALQQLVQSGVVIRQRSARQDDAKSFFRPESHPPLAEA